LLLKVYDHALQATSEVHRGSRPESKLRVLKAHWHCLAPRNVAQCVPHASEKPPRRSTLLKWKAAAARHSASAKTPPRRAAPSAHCHRGQGLCLWLSPGPGRPPGHRRRATVTRRFERRLAYAPLPVPCGESDNLKKIKPEGSSLASRRHKWTLRH
jgi:hypothetical protein